MKTDYRQYLKNELEQRCRRNPAYSLRSFATALDLKPPHLSAVLNGKKGLSQSSAAKIADALRWDKKEKQTFCDLVTIQHGRSKADKDAAQVRLKVALKEKAYQTINLDEFKMISDWHHFAILHLFELKDFEPSVDWISKKLSLPKIEIEQALTRLENVGRIERRGKVWKLNTAFISTPNVPSTAIRHHHHQILTKAAEALEKQSILERDFSSIMMAMDDSKIPEAKEWIQDFRRKFCADLDKSSEKNKVYCLAVQLFKMSN
jgi:uncharacterized protein (TIGR02147 family)